VKCTGGWRAGELLLESTYSILVQAATKCAVLCRLRAGMVSVGSVVTGVNGCDQQ
jgi:hypothetical protein